VLLLGGAEDVDCIAVDYLHYLSRERLGAAEEGHCEEWEEQGKIRHQRSVTEKSKKTLRVPDPAD